MLKRLIAITWLAGLAGCASLPPQNPENICDIFSEKPHWYNAAIEAKEKWGVPVHLPMAIMYQESTFRYDAKPGRVYLLGIIPWGRKSSAYGYAQALDGTWAQYKNEAGSLLSRRDNFNDAMDFMGWYIHQNHKKNGVSKWDAYGQYLAYHEGWTGYQRKTYNQKPWLKDVARTVQARAQRFSAQYAKCQNSLSRGGLFW